MSAPQYVPKSARPGNRVYESPPWQHDPWVAHPAGNLDEGQPRGHFYGNQGPDQGYGLVLANRFKGRLALAAAPHRHARLAAGHSHTHRARSDGLGNDRRVYTRCHGHITACCDRSKPATLAVGGNATGRRLAVAQSPHLPGARHCRHCAGGWHPRPPPPRIRHLIGAHLLP